MVYDIAGLRVLIKNEYDYTTKFCREYLSENQDLPVQITASVTKAELEAERTLSPGFSDGYVENICLYRSICTQMPTFGRILLHASILEYGGNAYAFLGKSGTGKSTHSKLWLSTLPTRVINGDKPILEYRDGEFIAYGTPWMGKERWGGKISAPLKGLCFLQQAKQNQIRRLSVAEGVAKLFTQILIPEEEENAAATLALADKMVTEIPMYLLQCDISEEAVRTSFEEMTGESYAEKRRKQS